MSTAPRLVITSRPMSGAGFDIPDGHTEIGSAQDSEIQLNMDGVSRRHASLDHDGDQVVLSDLGSRNGTWVNGHRITGGYVLRAGDRLQIGLVELRFLHSASSRPPSPPPPSYGFGDVNGPVNAGHGTQNVGGYHQVAGRDIYGDDIRVNNDYDPVDEIFQGRGVGRLLLILGFCIALTGFVIFGSFILGNMTSDIPRNFGNPFQQELLPGIPKVVAGAVLFMGGGVLAQIGSSMSKAARKRAEERRRRRRRR